MITSDRSVNTFSKYPIGAIFEAALYLVEYIQVICPITIAVLVTHNPMTFYAYAFI